jgi:hypothetical protein
MAWSSALKTAISLYKKEEYEECITHTRTVLKDNTPNYARVRYCSLLACCIKDWYEAEVFNPSLLPKIILLTNINYRKCVLTRKTHMLLGVFSIAIIQAWKECGRIYALL